jgi:peptidoglycan hydrolase-like protein with peptidoglycan-binding domain
VVHGSIIAPFVLNEVVIPDFITVHLGTPDQNARNVRVRFTDYLKNVASSEIYSTWPIAALIANVHVITTFALSRVYTEWYKSRGYSFDITNSTAYDQAFFENRNIFDNISGIVDNVFNQYVRRAGRKEPFFTSFCNGTTSTCNGLSQWGTVGLANQGMTPLQILRYYYPNDVEIVETSNIMSIPESYPGTTLKEGSSNDAVKKMQGYLNRIRANYPLIPSISNANGTFGLDTTKAVKTFQQIFGLTQDGVVGKNTWYKIVQIYVAITKLAALDSEGERIGIGLNPPTSVLKVGSKGADVVELQFLLNFIAQFFPSVLPVVQDGTFRETTRESVIGFQRQFELTRRRNCRTRYMENALRSLQKY